MVFCGTLWCKHVVLSKHLKSTNWMLKSEMYGASLYDNENTPIVTKSLAQYIINCLPLTRKLSIDPPKKLFQSTYLNLVWTSNYSMMKFWPNRNSHKKKSFWLCTSLNYWFNPIVFSNLKYVRCIPNKFIRNWTIIFSPYPFQCYLHKHGIIFFQSPAGIHVAIKHFDKSQNWPSWGYLKEQSMDYIRCTQRHWQAIYR